MRISEKNVKANRSTGLVVGAVLEISRQLPALANFAAFSLASFAAKRPYHQVRKTRRGLTHDCKQLKSRVETLQ